MTEHEGLHQEAASQTGVAGAEEEEGLQDGMLPRDLPKRTTFYDPVAERQMSQTDAKLFYQRSKFDVRSSTRSGSQATPHDSPVILSRSHPPTEYGADSLTLDQDHQKSDLQQVQAGVSERTPAAPSNVNAYGETPTRLRGRSISGDGLTSGRGIPVPSSSIPGVSNVGLSGSSLFDTEPQITAELSAISKNIQRILDTRRKYITLSSQGPEDNPRDSPDWEIYPPPPEPAWKQKTDKQFNGYEQNPSYDKSTLDDLEDPAIAKSSASASSAKKPTRKRKPGQNIGEDFDLDDLLPLPGDDGKIFKLDESGVYQVFDNDKAEKPAICVPTIREFYMDLDDILTISSDGPSKSFAFRRLQYLEGKFNLYVLLNEYQETADSKKVPHRDFYNVRKVDTHVHHSACMNQKHLLRFIKSKMKKFPNEVVLFRDGKHLTLDEVFASIKLTAYDLSIDTLDMHVRPHVSMRYTLILVLNYNYRRIPIRFIASTSSI